MISRGSTILVAAIITFASFGSPISAVAERTSTVVPTGSGVVGGGKMHVITENGFGLQPEALVYKVKMKSVSKERVLALAKELGMSAPQQPAPSLKSRDGKVSSKLAPYVSSDGRTGHYCVNSQQAFLQMHSDGFIEYYRGDISESEGEAPGEEETKVIVSRFLVRAGLVPSGARLRLEISGGETSTRSDANNAPVGKTLVLTRAVTAWITIPGSPIENSWIDVTVAHGGRITGVLREVREVEPLGKYSTVSVGDMVSRVADQADDVTEREGRSIHSVKLKSASVHYYEPASGDEPVDYVLPQYVVRAVDADTGDAVHEIRVPALRTDWSPPGHSRPKAQQ